MGKKPTTALAIHEETNGIVALSDVPDYLVASNTSDGLIGLDGSDFKIPRIQVLQPLSPALRSFPGEARPDEFWHNGANMSLGKEFIFVPCVASKRVILWAPRDTMEGGMLAFSADGKNWTTGGNKTFDITLKGNRKVKWSTGKSVPQSRLLDWGSSDPDDDSSTPAATLVYEYLCYLPGHPELSPCMLGVYRTGVNNAKKLNTNLLMQRKPIASIAVKCFVDIQQEGKNTWSVPNFKLAGFVQRKDFDIACDMAEQYGKYTSEQVPEDVVSVNSSTSVKDGDEISY